MYRRFGYLQARLLLDKQDQLRRLEERLERLDEKVTESDPDRLCTRDLSGDDAVAHESLMKTIEENYCSYGE